MRQYVKFLLGKDLHMSTTWVSIIAIVATVFIGVLAGIAIAIKTGSSRQAGAHGNSGTRTLVCAVLQSIVGFCERLLERLAGNGAGEHRYLDSQQVRADRLVRELNSIPQEQVGRREQVARKLFGALGENSCIKSTFQCDLGTNIYIGDNFFANFGCVILDWREVRIGDNVILGPGVHICASTHPLDPVRRRTEWGNTQPITIGDDVWVCDGAAIHSGVTIGDGAVIGAGAVVTKDVPAGALMVGNPAEFLRYVAGPNAVTNEAIEA
jgi:maltose O-acetyltransferase